jgi:hypothetical protein
VADIVLFSARLGRAMNDANNNARALITEAPRPRDPSTLELLIMMATDAAFVGLSAALATHVRSVANTHNDVRAIERRIAAEGNCSSAPVHVPAAPARASISELEIEVLREYAKDATKRGGRTAVAAASTPGQQSQPLSAASGLGFQSQYLLALGERTSGLVADVSQRFKRHEPQLRRLPIEDLEAVSAALTEDVAKAIGEAYLTASVMEWTNLVARATHTNDDDGKLVLNQGMYGPERQPLGVIRVDVSGDGGRWRISRASLDMPNDAIVSAVKTMAPTLGALPVHRMLVVNRMYSEQRWMVRPDHQIEGIDNERPGGLAGVAHDAETQQLRNLLDAYPSERLVSA